MKKSSFVATMLGTFSGMMFALGMCMALISEWNLFVPGIIFGGLGILMGLVTVGIWRKMEHKQPLRLSGKTVLTVIVTILGVLALGIGMCFCMVWGWMIAGIIIGMAGIMALLCLIVITRGIKE